MKKAKRLPAKLQPWLEASKRFKLSHAHIQMARELGLNPKKFGSLYEKSFGRSHSENVRSLEEVTAPKRSGVWKSGHESKREGNSNQVMTADNVSGLADFILTVGEEGMHGTNQGCVSPVR